jgi:uncharacterized membrane protein YgdD (TMEM256/DUF423 family)
MKISGKQFLVIGAFLAGLGVALGAVGSHALKDFLIGNNRTETFEIAVRYQLYHGLALIMVGILCYVVTEVNFFASGMLLLMGVILFSGSLYALSLTALRWVVYLTPVGGMLMISGWLILIIQLIKSVK